MRAVVALLCLVVIGCATGDRGNESVAATEPATPAMEHSQATAAAELAIAPTQEVDGVAVKLTGIELGPGDTVQVRWQLINQTAKERVLAGRVDDPDARFRLTADAFLVDEAHRKTYRVLVDDNEEPVASRHGDPDWVAVAPGEAIDAWAKFPAPPDDTVRVSVHVPGVPPFEDVRLPARR